MSEERQPWERVEGEPHRWFQRFEAFRLMGPGRSLLACVNQEKVAKSKKESRQAPGSWRSAARAWDWRTRAEAWDQHLVDQATAAQEAAWRARIMGPLEVQALLSDQARGDLGQFFKISDRWTEHPLPTDEILNERQVTKRIGRQEEEVTEYRVRKVVLDLDKVVDPRYSPLLQEFTDSPRDGLGIKLVSKVSTEQTIAKINGLLADRSTTLNVDLTQLTDDQLKRLAAGEDILHVLAAGSPG